jgi:hypothetical protein
MILFLCPMGLSKQRALLVAAEIANAWSAVEVFVLSIVAALFQISTFASFIIGDKCDLINRLAEDFIGEIIEDTVCFTVEASVESNCWYLVAGVFLYSFVVSVGMRFAHNALDERIERSSQQGSSLGGSRTIARKIFDLPVIGGILFGAPLPYSEANNETMEGEEEEEQPEWRHWF